MRTSLFFASGITVVLFGACVGDEPHPPDAGFPDAGLPDAGLAEVGVFEASSLESSTSTDASPSDASTDTNVATDSSVTDAGLDGSASADADASGTLTWPLDENTGANTFGGGLNTDNFVVSGTFITANAGAEWFGSGDGSGSGNGLSLKQNLGGIVQNKPYTVSFYVSKPDSVKLGIDFADFTKLRIGGPNGAMVWTSTVTPTTEDVWVKWTGTYTPVAGDVGGPFYFEATFDLGASQCIGIDGPITAMP